MAVVLCRAESLIRVSGTAQLQIIDEIGCGCIFGNAQGKSYDEVIIGTSISNLCQNVAWHLHPHRLPCTKWLGEIDLTNKSVEEPRRLSFNKDL